MKKLLWCLFMMLCFQQAYAQADEDSTAGGNSSLSSIGNPLPNDVPTFALNPTDVSSDVAAYLAQKLTSYNAYSFDYSALNNYMTHNYYAIEFNLGSTFLSLQRRDIRASDYRQTSMADDGTVTTDYTQDLLNDPAYEVHMLKGFADNNKSLNARFSVTEDGLTGYIVNGEDDHVMYYVTLQDFIRDNGDQPFTNDNFLLCFDLGNIIGNPNAVCGLLTLSRPLQKGTGTFTDCSPRFLTIAAEGDYYWCQAYGSNATNKILENLFFVEGIYSINFNMSFVVRTINLLPSSPNIYNKTNAYQRLYDFQNRWNSTYTSVNRDVTLLYSGIYSDTLGASFVGSLSCATNSGAYGIVCKNSKLTLVTSHELGHIFGSQHDNGPGGYGSSPCSGGSVPIMCASAVSGGPNYYFSSITRSVILGWASGSSACLSDYWNGSPVNKILKSWSNAQNGRWIATWLMQNQDQMVAGNFDGQDNDEEIFFAAPDNAWVGIMDFSCQQGTDWYHMWGNSGNGRFGTWIRNSGDKYMAGDFDGNGKSDLFSVSGSAYWAALQEYAPTSWSWTHKWGNAGTRWIAGWYINTNDKYVIGDYDGDGRDELFCVNPNGWAQIIKFNWVASGGGGYYNPQTIWSNNGNKMVGGQYIANIQRWYKGKMKTTAKDELFTIGNSYTGVMRFSGSGTSATFTFITGESITTSFTTPNTTPAHASFRFMGTGNLDGDGYDEYVAISQQWIGTQDYSGGGPGMNHNWNNGGTGMLNDWNMNTDVDYLLVKAAPTSGKQILGRWSVKRSSGWGPWYRDWWEPALCGMYRANAPIQNFKPAPGNGNESGSGPGLSYRNINVYPNPTSSVVNVMLGEGIVTADATVTDIMGKRVASKTITPADKTISLGNCAPGTYYINVSLPDHSVFTSKVVVYEK